MKNEIGIVMKNVRWSDTENYESLCDRFDSLHITWNLWFHVASSMDVFRLCHPVSTRNHSTESVIHSCLIS